MAFSSVKMLFVIFVVQGTIVTCADISYLNDTIRNYFADTRHHDPKYSDYKSRAKEFVFKEFKRFGLDTKYQTSRGLQGNIFNNVIGVLKGDNFAKNSDKVLAIVAHYDTEEATKGVNDNGSGVAAMLEVARQLHEQYTKRKYTVIFASTDADGDIFVPGSAYRSSRHSHDWINTWAQTNYGDSNTLLKNAQGFIVLDTVMEYNSSNSQHLPNGEHGYTGHSLAILSRQTRGDTLAEHFKRSWEAQGRGKYKIEWFASSNASREWGILHETYQTYFRDTFPEVYITDSGILRGTMKECPQALKECQSYNNSGQISHQYQYQYRHIGSFKDIVRRLKKECQRCANLEMMLTMLTDDNLQYLGKTADSLARTIDELSGVIHVDTNGKEKNTPCQMAIIVVAVMLSVVFQKD